MFEKSRAIEEAEKLAEYINMKLAPFTESWDNQEAIAQAVDRIAINRYDEDDEDVSRGEEAKRAFINLYFREWYK